MIQVRVVSDAGECSTSGLDDTAKVDYVSGQLARSWVIYNDNLYDMYFHSVPSVRHTKCINMVGLGKAHTSYLFNTHAMHI